MRLSSHVSLPPIHEILIQAPLDSLDIMDRLVNVLTGNSSRLENLVNNASILLNQRIGSVAAYDWADSSASVDSFMKNWTLLAGDAEHPFMHEKKHAAEQGFQSLPPVLRKAVNHILTAVVQSHDWMALGRDSISDFRPMIELEDILCQAEITPQEIRVLEQLMERADRKAIFRAGAMMASSLGSLIDHAEELRSVDWEETLRIPTALGDILVAGKSDDRHALSRPPLLMIDCGGNDVYSGVYAQSRGRQSYSIVIDLEGDDLYQSEGDPFGAACALWGFAGLFDLGAGSDRYEGGMRCFGYSFCGASILYDERENSTYKADSHCFGAGEMGMAFHIDREGDDVYEAFFNAQGYGAYGGLGMLWNAEGSDHYIAYATPVVHPSAQLSTHNYSASQGFGGGRFGPNLDGRSLPGGVGILLDEAGDDIYEAGVFAQGAGYGFGIGMLADLAGQDVYRAAWYAMGASAHQGGGFFLEREGDDAYEASHYMAAGAAVDYSLGLFSDRSGDDVYQMKNAALGYGLSNSLALFIDHAGNDRYHLLEGLGAGAAQNEMNRSFRGLWPTFGFFLDVAGTDQYIELPACQNHAQWRSSGDGSHSVLYTLGID
ncbi:MAG: hypothetical protein ACP5I1_14110, partial [Candidatus Hinthialibacter sp.]